MYMIGKWPDELKEKHALLVKQIHIATKRRIAADVFLQEHAQELVKYSRQSQVMLGASNYEKACTLARVEPYYCHGDGGPTNFIVSPKGLYLIDFETLRIDMRAYDLYRVIYNTCKDHGWDFAIARSILIGYETVTELNQSDIDFTAAWLRFPRTTTLLLNKLFRTKSPRVRSDSVRLLPAALADERKVTSFLMELASYKDMS